MDLSWTFGDRLRKIRRAAGLSQADIASMVGTGPSSIANWETGASKCRDQVAVARALERVLGVPAAWTLGLDETGEPPVTPRYPVGAPSGAFNMTGGTLDTPCDKVVDLDRNLMNLVPDLLEPHDLGDAPDMREGPITSFIAPWCAARNYSPASTRQRTTILTTFARSCGDPLPGDLEPDDVLEWWASVQHLSPASRRSMRSAVVGFFDFLVAIGQMSVNPASAIATPRVPRTVPKVLTTDEVDRLRASLTEDRDRIAVEAMLGAGLRVSEVVRLRGEHFRDDGLFTVTGKGGHTDLLPMPSRLAPLVAGRTGLLVPINAQSLGARMVILLQRAGIEGHSAHSLRRTFATRMAELNDIATVQKALRHSSLATTQHYVAPRSVEEWRLPA
jgi:integrase/recombinase XerD